MYHNSSIWRTEFRKDSFWVSSVSGYHQRYCPVHSLEFNTDNIRNQLILQEVLDVIFNGLDILDSPHIYLCSAFRSYQLSRWITTCWCLWTGLLATSFASSVVFAFGDFGVILTYLSFVQINLRQHRRLSAIRLNASSSKYLTLLESPTNGWLKRREEPWVASVTHSCFQLLYHSVTKHFTDLCIKILRREHRFDRLLDDLLDVRGCGRRSWRSLNNTDLNNIKKHVCTEQQTGTQRATGNWLSIKRLSGVTELSGGTELSLTVLKLHYFQAYCSTANCLGALTGEPRLHHRRKILSLRYAAGIIAKVNHPVHLSIFPIRFEQRYDTRPRTIQTIWLRIRNMHRDLRF